MKLTLDPFLFRRMEILVRWWLWYIVAAAVVLVPVVLLVVLLLALFLLGDPEDVTPFPLGLLHLIGNRPSLSCIAIKYMID
jgi:hypothetical protein